MLHGEVTDRIIKAFYKVYNTLGYSNYLKATNKEVGLLLNFGSKPEFRRIVFTNQLKINPRESAQSASSAVYEGSNP